MAKKPKKIDRRVFKKEGEELQQYLHFMRRGSRVESGKAYNRQKMKKEGRGVNLSFVFGCPRSKAPGRISIISHRSDFVNSHFAQTSGRILSRICAILPVDFWCGLWYTIIVKGRE